MLSERCLSCLSVNVGVLWPNGWMDQDEIWRAGRHRPLPHCVRWGPNPRFPKRAEPPIFGPFLLWPNGWMHQDATWYRGRPQPRRLCIRWGPSSPPQKGAEPPIFGPRLLWPDGRPSQLLIISYDTMRWTILTCAQKLTSSQLSLPHGTKQKAYNEVIFR